MNVEQTLKDRGSVYGDYRTGVKARADMLSTMNAIHVSEHGCEMTGTHKGYVLDILNKLIRIAVTPTHIDSWHDIQGYAKLVEDELRRVQDANR